MKVILAIATSIATTTMAVDKVASEGGISLTYDDGTFPELKIEKQKKLTMQDIGDGVPEEVGPEHFVFYLRDKRPLPAYDKGARYFSPSQSRVEVIPLFDQTEKDYGKAYKGIASGAKDLGKFLDRAPKSVPWFSPKMDPDERDRITIPDVVFYNASPAYQTKLRYVEDEKMRGVFFVSQYTQEWPIWPNQEETAYFFHGLSKDGRYAIVAEFAITHPGIPKGIDFVPQGVKDGKVTEEEVKAEVEKLAAEKDETFTPKLTELRKIVGSLKLPAGK